MPDIEWHEESGSRQPAWRLALDDLDVVLTRIPAVAGAKLRSWSGLLSPEQRSALDAALVHFGARRMPSATYVAGWGGTLSLAASPARHVVVFSNDAKEPCPPEDWLRFPAGAASDVVELFVSLRTATYGPPSTLPSWRPPPCEGSPAGEKVDPDQRVVLSHATTAPNVVDSRRRFEQMRWFASGRACSETLWIDDSTGSTSVIKGTEKHLDPTLIASTSETLRKLRFFSEIGNVTGSCYDGEELIVCHHLGARLEKMLSYEVEMGARCGLSLAENQGLDLVHALVRRSRADFD